MNVNETDSWGQEQRLEYLLDVLMNENPEDGSWLQKRYGNSFALFRGLVNLRPPKDCSDTFIAVQDAYLQEITREKGIVDVDSLVPVPGHKKLFLWQGDITRLKTDAIVNAANSQMLGCWEPNHGCIDNMIHTMSGVQLRQECAKVMHAQGHEEAAGGAKITPGYNLPARYVLHTVGPIVHGDLTEEHKSLLQSSYQSCLELAAEQGLCSVVFCCISTGVFGFPKEEAACIAIQTAMAFLQKDTSIQKIVFNVFKEEDKLLYQKILSQAPAC